LSPGQNIAHSRRVIKICPKQLRTLQDLPAVSKLQCCFHLTGLQVSVPDEKAEQCMIKTEKSHQWAGVHIEQKKIGQYTLSINQYAE
jgi:hypothetical protein